MRFVVATAPGVVELAYMWLPQFAGMDPHLKAVIENDLAARLVGKEMTEEVLDAAHDRVIELICETHPSLPGLRDYLDAVKFVEAPR